MSDLNSLPANIFQHCRHFHKMQIYMCVEHLKVLEVYRKNVYRILQTITYTTRFFILYPNENFSHFLFH